ncbi:MAG: DUF4303 domain-containing protein [Arthrobacter sp.]|uniref:DUF4303 domain-containing protein n=1 Tax=unclassified Arthrobacter TaxID=235627 RepID=UPI00265392D3|nr:DUF4303 domain-containing protein [Micrococcaceae bacterium]MDN5813539.1 DUF4303 domain-containing protein [Micrococcaceae bacterium]MDN5824497.1 DUF4303 domain-containing protein [Micrococcaceae bacterium]MDN5880161.1 DUF4303 domain-containing protein [Micrococcaceae bacterium]MDN5887569.1 DUF4303 domain-containing protein [Micrococcaceae bacterium]
MIENHPDHEFYAIALSGVSTDPAEPIELPVLALNSEQALDRDGDSVEEDLGVGDEPEETEEDGDGPDPLNTGHEDDGDDAEDTAEDSADDDDSDGFDVDGELAQLEAEGEAAESGASYYSSRWNPPEWHWCSMELFDESAAVLWREALTRVAESSGWEETLRRYYELLLTVVEDLRVELAHGRNAEIVAYVADDDHADALLRRSLTPEQLSRHFPDLVS